MLLDRSWRQHHVLSTPNTWLTHHQKIEKHRKNKNIKTDQKRWFWPKRRPPWAPARKNMKFGPGYVDFGATAFVFSPRLPRLSCILKPLPLYFRRRILSARNTWLAPILKNSKNANKFTKRVAVARKSTKPGPNSIFFRAGGHGGRRFGQNHRFW